MQFLLYYPIEFRYVTDLVIKGCSDKLEGIRSNLNSLLELLFNLTQVFIQSKPLFTGETTDWKVSNDSMLSGKGVDRCAFENNSVVGQEQGSCKSNSVKVNEITYTSTIEGLNVT